MTPDAPTAGDDPRAELEAELRALAERYYDAFRARRLEEAAALVAPTVLPSRRLVAGIVRRGEELEIPAAPTSQLGPDVVRRRRRGWSEPVPRRLWSVEAVHLDADGVRARVDTLAEGSYWMRRDDEGWRIVGFGSLTDEALDALGGTWPPGVVDHHLG